MDDKQKIQSQEYHFPYHYIPEVNNDQFKLSRRWGFAPSYLAALKVTKNWIDTITKQIPDDGWEHIDLGCGDGAFVHYLERMVDNPSLVFSGTDYDARAIAWARLFNPKKDFFSDGIEKLDEERYHSATLIEVTEHIPLAELDSFVESVAGVLVSGGQLLVTVPHKNKHLFDKHYQHFTFESLKKVFSSHFDVVDVKGFENHGLKNRIVKRFMTTKKFHLEWPGLCNYIVNSFAKLHSSESGVGRIALKLKKRA